MEFLFPGSIAVLIASAMVFILAWRGRRVSDHPHCRRCGFNLFGKPESSTKCSECGGDLNARRAIRIGHRKPMRRLRGGALIVFCCCALAIAAMSWIALKGSSWLSHEPLWLLRLQARSSNTAVRDAAIGEINSRLIGKQLSKPQIQQLLSDALASQADRTRAWSPGWGDFIEAADSDVTSVQRKQYHANMYALRLIVPPVVRAGDILPIRVAFDAPRCGTRAGQPAGVVISCEVDGMEFDHVPKAYVTEQISTVVFATRGASGFRKEFGDAEFLAQVGPGASRAGFDVFYNEVPQVELPKGPVSVHTKVRMLSYERTDIPTDWNFDREIRILPAVSSGVSLIHEPDLAESIRSTMAVNARVAAQTLDVSIHVSKAPVAIASDVLVRIGTKEFRVGELVVAAGTDGTFKQTLLSRDALWNGALNASVTQVDVILWPNDKLAEATRKMHSIWGDGIRFEGIPTTGPVLSGRTPSMRVGRAGRGGAGR